MRTTRKSYGIFYAPYHSMLAQTRSQHKHGLSVPSTAQASYNPLHSFDQLPVSPLEVVHLSANLPIYLSDCLYVCLFACLYDCHTTSACRAYRSEEVHAYLPTSTVFQFKSNRNRRTSSTKEANEEQQDRGKDDQWRGGVGDTGIYFKRSWEEQHKVKNVTLKVNKKLI